MRKKDLFLVTSAVAAGLVALSTKNSSPMINNLAIVLTAASAYLATPYRNKNKRERSIDPVLFNLKKKIEGEAGRIAEPERVKK